MPVLTEVSARDLYVREELENESIYYRHAKGDGNKESEMRQGLRRLL